MPSTESNLLMENEREKKLIKALTLLYKTTLSIFNSLYAILKELPISLRYCLTLSCGRNQFSIIKNFGLRRYTKNFSGVIIRSFLHFTNATLLAQSSHIHFVMPHNLLIHISTFLYFYIFILHDKLDIRHHK